MKYVFFLLFGFLFFVSCKTANITPKNAVHQTYNESKSKSVVKEAKTFLGIKYKFAGINEEGMDCSGLVFVSHQKVSVHLPRRAKDQAVLGFSVSQNQIKIGDLLFFNTFGNEISHVGIVEQINGGEIFFIHSSTSKGVMISSMNEPYWKSRFILAKRILK
jgi:cell wall-associated NlpC family hydrolase